MYVSKLASQGEASVLHGITRDYTQSLFVFLSIFIDVLGPKQVCYTALHAPPPESQEYQRSHTLTRHDASFGSQVSWGWLGLVRPWNHFGRIVGDG